MIYEEQEEQELKEKTIEFCKTKENLKQLRELMNRELEIFMGTEKKRIRETLPAYRKAYEIEENSTEESLTESSDSEDESEIEEKKRTKKKKESAFTTTI